MASEQFVIVVVKKLHMINKSIKLLERLLNENGGLYGNHKDIYETEKVLQDTINILEKCKWHDLNKNPDDLPTRAGEYLVFAPLYKQIAADEFDETPQYSVQPYLKFANGMHWSGDICQDEVWLWKELEVYNEENE